MYIKSWRIIAVLAVLFCLPAVASAQVAGDVTGDDEVDVSDIQCTVLTALNAVDPPCLAEPGAADANCDGSTDVVDIQLAVLVVLAYPQPGVPEDKDENGNNIHDDCEGAGGCGDGQCQGLENCDSCPEDCDECCGNGICDTQWGETCENCVNDCTCGDEFLPGDILIIEIMQDPKAAPDAQGEWFEIRVVKDEIDLQGWTLKDNSGQTHVINAGGSLPTFAGQTMVLGINSNLATNGNVQVNYQYSNFTLEAADQIILVSPGGTVVDQVAYYPGTFLEIPGRSISLTTTAMSHTGNDDGANWCPSTMVCCGGDFGSPGIINPTCATGVECGDGAQEAWEQCDDSNTSNGDGCSEFCQVEVNCGNGQLDFGEECDDGNLLAGDGCGPFCLMEAICGNNNCEFTESCSSCPEDCGQCQGQCGNGIVEPGEECDDGPNGSMECTPDCKEKSSGNPECGDGKVEGTEQCDDGNLIPGDGCDANCENEGGGNAECGNGVVEPENDETCDDGNTENGDGCNEWCKWEWKCCEPSPCCCDGNLDAGEQCDDGNDSAGDGCDKECKLEGVVTTGVAGSVLYGGSVPAGHMAVVMAFDVPISDPNSIPDDLVPVAAESVEPPFPANFEMETPTGQMWLVAGLAAGLEDPIEGPVAYADNPVNVTSGNIVSNIDLDLGGGSGGDPGCVSGTISYSGNVTANDRLRVVLSSLAPPAIEPVGTPLEVKPVTFPYNYQKCNVDPGVYWVVGFLDVGDNNAGQPGAEDLIGQWINVNNPQSVTVESGETVSGINFTLAPQ